MDPRIYPNRRTRWYGADNLAVLLSVLSPGDLLEFERHPNKLWAICVEKEDVVRVVYKSAARDHIARISIDFLLDVLGRDRVRINNSDDKVLKPSPVRAILSRALGNVGHEHYFDNHRQLANDSELFVRECRYFSDRRNQQYTPAFPIKSVCILAAVVGVVVFGYMMYR